MKLRGIVAEDFANYKEPSLFLVTAFCDWKCCHEGGFDESVCQNNELVSQPIREISVDDICKFYLSNPITKAVVIGGLEPFAQYQEVLDFIITLRQKFQCEDDIIIYTGYYENELEEEIESLSHWKNIIIKFGRYMPEKPSVHDEVLGIDLVSPNQYAKRIS